VPPVTSVTRLTTVVVGAALLEEEAITPATPAPTAADTTTALTSASFICSGPFQGSGPSRAGPNVIGS
jgi:hypothetical protein